MRYHLKLRKGLSYCGVVSATKHHPDVFTENGAVADAAVATGYFILVGTEETEETAYEASVLTGYLDQAQLEGMEVKELKAMAMQMGINTKGMKVKKDYIDAITAQEVNAPASDISGDGENELDYSDGSPTMIELQAQ
jgi:hypothetical protein